ncbi:sugar transferase [Erysipelothrix sp. HDW6B]|uniref:sugar transferase n=1 Tax=Erysipelothrix sp. HDW6B TaxID=2714929 RepID=UPI00140B7A23|nr:sugar transferase [Erysipelothrix sp. HDW6B]QIK86863.1 sugar transferase [Erysipelothrix sp. HDW6B]
MNVEMNEEIKVKPTGFLVFKRIADVVLTILASPFIIILVAIFAVAVKVDSKGPAFYTQMRIGKGQKEFKIYKLRSMRIDAESDTGAVWAEKDDPRVTKVGRFIRKVRIDELPQFLNVLIGDMSIIGPRPERADLTWQFEKEIPGFINRLSIRPGITGWAQVNGGYDISPAEKLAYDTVYINNMSLKQDMVIVGKTIGVIFTGDGAR